MTHPLIGKFIKIDVDDHQAHVLSCVTADLGNGLMLARRYSPSTGDAFDSQHIISLSAIAGDDSSVEIFDDWQSYRREYQAQKENACDLQIN